MALAAGVFAALAVPASGFWRMPCSNPLVVERADPVVSPGAVSGHIHTIMGGSGFGFTMDYAQARASACSSCIITQDMSNYWVPALYYHAANGSFISVEQVGGATIYYLQRQSNGEKLFAFPPGFRMLAGNPFLRNFTGDTAAQAISFACIDYQNGGPETNGFPTKNCPQGLRAQVFFPSCWDGVNLDSPDHKSHMSYPSVYNSGVCPPSHPKRFISLFYEVTWNVDDFKDMWTDGKWPFVLSSGDPTGFGYHGDFVNGWDVDVLQTAIDTCNSNSGSIDDCAVLKKFPSDVLQDCKIPPSIDEQVFGVLPALPGCNPIQNGPGQATPKSGCGAPTTFGEPQTYFTDLTASMGWEYVGCGHDSSSDRTFKGDSFRDAAMTVEKCVNFCAGKGFTFAGLEFTNECYCDNSLPADRAPIPGVLGNCDMACAGDAAEFCGGGSRLSIYQKCPSSSSCKNSLFGVTGNTTATTQTQSTSQSTTSSRPTTTSQSQSSTRTSTSSSSSTRDPGTSTAIASHQSSKTSSTGSIRSTSASIVGSRSSVKLQDGWEAAGCYVDPINPRALSTWAYYGEPVTSSGCATECNNLGYKFAGTENGGQCFCGNALQGATAADSADCNVPCDGDADEICGGPARLSVFTNGGSTARLARRYRYHA
ncbi:hypothetical protein GP486_005282 [Trichoglossum hirsutum]|uniref:WSC domain-containing protein n=1 Tax=Trichoglossum hirsutum TaxID=265104 RepID=A0A9P8RMJ8_9PEZI|nr:hypothetical protein GP486_005282 [Trichoglossum hirsutum]